MSEDMSDMMKKIGNMLNSGDMPDGMKDFIKNTMANSNNNNNDNSNGSSDSSKNTNSSQDFSIDMETMMKMKQIMDEMKKDNNDPRANLLLSLKPYLRESRKDKVDQYIKLFKMGKVAKFLGPLGGDKKDGN